jgi:hypothetical protein
MKNVILTIFWVFYVSMFTYSQEKVIVSEQTLEISRSEEFFFGFADGDEIVFSLNVADGNTLGEVSISKYPDDVKFKDYKTSSIADKSIKVQGDAIYRFELKNPKKVICKIKIERIPKDETLQNFNTSVYWKEVLDTIYTTKAKDVTVGYENFEISKNRRELDKIDTTILEVLSRTERVHSTTNLSNNSLNKFHFTLPLNKYNPAQIYPMESEETVSWAYSIVVGENGKKWFEDANKKVTTSGAIRGLINFAGYSSGVGAIALFAINGYSAFSAPPTGENIKFSIFSATNTLISSGNSVAAVGRVSNSNEGNYYISLENDNLMNGLNVTISVVAVRVLKKWKNVPYTETKQRKVTEKQVVNIPKKVEKRKVPFLSK